MALPKRKLSRSRTRHRRANWLRATPPTVVACATCKAPTRPHIVCSSCGAYAGRTVLEV
jgi:large subunit ribosomal protein L32